MVRVDKWVLTCMFDTRFAPSETTGGQRNNGAMLAEAWPRNGEPSLPAMTSSVHLPPRRHLRSMPTWLRDAVDKP